MAVHESFVPPLIKSGYDNGFFYYSGLRAPKLKLWGYRVKTIDYAWAIAVARVFVFQCMASFQLYRFLHVFVMSVPSGRPCTVVLGGCMLP